MKLHNCTGDDLHDLLMIENSSFLSDRNTSSRFKQYLKSRSITVTLAQTVDKKPAGYAMVFYRKNSETCRLYSLAVLSEYRKLGVAQALMDGIYADMKDRGLTRIVLEVRPDNVPAIRFYEKNGFSAFGSFEEFYEDGTDALRMEKFLI